MKDFISTYDLTEIDRAMEERTGKIKNKNMKEPTNEDLKEPDDFYDDDYYENQPDESCPKCGRSYDDIDFDFQSCSKCGWDAEKGKYKHEIKREPENIDFLNGDADILTDTWN
jgi:hypothetical protein